MVLLLILFLVVVIGGGVLFVRFAKSLEPNQRIALVVAIILVAAYFVPKMIQGAIRGYRAAVEMDQHQGR
jgi:hypothetical protein